MSTLKWVDGGSADTVFTTDLNSLAANARALSSEDTNSSLYLYADFELVVRYASTYTAGLRTAEIYILPTLDGTNFPVGGTGVDPQRALLAGVFESRSPSTSTTERLIIRGITLPPRGFKVLLKNVATVAWFSSGNTLKMRKYGMQTV